MSFFGMPESVIAWCSTGDNISTSLCSSSRATADWTNETTATSLITGSPSFRVALAALAAPAGSLPSRPRASQVVLVTLVVLVGFAGRLPPQDRRVVGLELVGPLGLHPHAHAH